MLYLDYKKKIIGTLEIYYGRLKIQPKYYIVLNI